MCRSHNNLNFSECLSISQTLNIYMVCWKGLQCLRLFSVVQYLSYIHHENKCHEERTHVRYLFLMCLLHYISPLCFIPALIFSIFYPLLSFTFIVNASQPKCLNVFHYYYFLILSEQTIYRNMEEIRVCCFHIFHDFLLYLTK